MIHLLSKRRKGRDHQINLANKGEHLLTLLSFSFYHFLTNFPKNDMKLFWIYRIKRNHKKRISWSGKHLNCLFALSRKPVFLLASKKGVKVTVKANQCRNFGKTWRLLFKRTLGSQLPALSSNYTNWAICFISAGSLPLLPSPPPPPAAASLKHSILD